MYKLRGTNYEITTCVHCGDEGLKCTAVLEIVDADGEGTGIFDHVGEDCASRALGWGRTTLKCGEYRAEKQAIRERSRVDQQMTAQHGNKWHAFLRAYTGESDPMCGVEALGTIHDAVELYERYHRD